MLNFCQYLRGGKPTFYAQVRRFALGLYEEAADPGATIFLDKTPRYGLYIEELLTAFPDAPMIVLWRNPLSILGSLSRSFDDSRWTPHHHIVDLYDLLERLTSAVAGNPTRFYELRYEDLVEDPGANLRRLLKYLDLPWHDAVEQDFAATDVPGPVGDMARPGMFSHQTVVSSTALDRWQHILASPVRKRYAIRYLDWVGTERLQRMGYDREALRQQVLDAPTRWSTAPADVYFTARGVASRLLEPQILRDKWSKKRPRGRIISHS